MKNKRDFNIRFKGTIETCVCCEDIKIEIDNNCVSFFIGYEIIFYASLSDIVYIKEFFIDDCSFKTLYSNYNVVAG